jgi:hypothetical protein
VADEGALVRRVKLQHPLSVRVRTATHQQPLRRRAGLTSPRGAYGTMRLDGLNVLAVGQFDGNIWAREARLTRNHWKNIFNIKRLSPI